MRRIKAFEDSSPLDNWAFYGFLILGLSAIVTGIVALIAANWAFIPSSVKLVSNFILLFITSGFTLYAYKKNKPFLFEGLLFFFSLLCLATIGLISQVYHTGGRFEDAVILWLIICFGNMLVSKTKPLSFIWAIGFFVAVPIKLIKSPELGPFFEDHFMMIFASIPFFFFIGSLIFSRFSKKFFSQKYAFQFLSLFSAVGFLKNLNLFFMIEEPVRWDLNPYALIPFYLLCLVSCLMTLGLSQLRREQKITLCGLCVSYAILPLFMLFNYSLLISLSLKALSLLILMTAALFFASQKLKYLFQLFLILSGLLVLMIYGQALGSLSKTGWGLISYGAFILTLIYLWKKYRLQLQLWAERFI